MHKSAKPVRKCHGCPLNLGKRCAVFTDPHKQWHPGKCRGFRNEEMHKRYAENQAKHPPDPGKKKRREHARLAKTEPHYDGTLSHRSPLAKRRRSP